MVTVLVRTFIIYGVLVGALRLMGKRQIGELELSELVTTLLISEIASLPIENGEYPILYAVIPIVTLLFVEIFSSTLLVRIPFLKSLLSSRPTVLVRDGVPIPRALKGVRITLEELLSSLRQKGVTDIGEVDYAILEPNGQLSVIEKRRATPPSSEDLGIAVKESGITHILIANGRIDRHNLRCIGNCRTLINTALRREGCRVCDVLLMLADDLGRTTVILKEERRNTAEGGAQ